MAVVSTNTIINAALRKIGAFDSGESASGVEYESAELAFDLLIKDLVVRGADLFTRRLITVFLQKDQQSYSFGVDHTTETYVETTLSAAEALGQTALSVTSETGMTVADYVGVKLDDDSIHWSTISSLAPLTIAASLPSAAASGNKVYTYTTKSGIPKKLVYALRRDTDSLDTQIRLIGEAEYLGLSDKASEGPAVSAWYHPSSSTGKLYVWPINGEDDKVVVSAQVIPSTLPGEWGNPLVWGLAAELAPEYAVPEREMRMIVAMADRKIEEVLAYDTENASVVFGMGGE